LTHLGVTGHQSIPEGARDFVRQTLKTEIKHALLAGQLWGITSLAVGADQMFAELVLQAGGRLHVIIPSAMYERTFDAEGLTRYQALLASATRLERLKFDEPTEEAFFAAGRRVVDLCDTLLAVWDGKPSRGLGGTADVVNYAQSSGRQVAIVWPADVAR
jgi:hypothetical protein